LIFLFFNVENDRGGQNLENQTNDMTLLTRHKLPFYLISVAFTLTHFSALCEMPTRPTHEGSPTHDHLPNSADPAVKKSLNNVCYAKSHIGYSQTFKYTPYNSMDECRSSGGRPAKASKHK
jgi:hypothetical protein